MTMKRHRLGFVAAVGAAVVGQVSGSFGSGDDPNERPQVEVDPFFDLSDFTDEQVI
jgi:hypothetical protein